jgi:hypothetical protein
MNNTKEEFYKQKYLKYKAKYLEAKENIKGGDDKCLSFGKPRCAINSACKWYDDTNKCEQKRCNDYNGELTECEKKPYCQFTVVKRKGTVSTGLCQPKK